MSQDQVKPYFSSGGLPPSPQCEHGVEQRWCNNSRASDGRLCADIQVAADLKRLSEPTDLRVVRLVARSVKSHSWGIVGYFTSPDKVSAGRAGFGPDWWVYEEVVPLDVILCRETPGISPPQIQSAVKGELHGINEPSDQHLADMVARSPVLANKIRGLLRVKIL